jgi:hypothetical protein
MTKRDYSMIWAYVDNPIKEAVLTLAKAKGVSISEYVRSLVLEDLDKRTFFTTILKNNTNKETVPNVK